ncbi:conserved phage C-terminal domain-containing protein [Bacillus subtilis]
MHEPKKSYYAIIPANVRYDNNIRPNAKLLYGEITALCNEKGYCWATNQYFADLYSVSKKSVSNWINELVEQGYITNELIYKEGSKEILHRYIRIVQYPNEEKFHRGMEEKVKDNNTSFNNTSNNTSNRYNVGKPDGAPYKEIVSYLNEKTGSKYRHTTNATQRLIKARLNEGFSVEDFKRVIDNKTAEWLNDKKMAEYLRPQTLFGTKFESYLNQSTANNFTGGGGYDTSEYDDLF